MKFIFLLIALFAFAFSNEYYDNYGCELRGKNRCCWLHYSNCCQPPQGPRTCENDKTLCCKYKEYSMEEGEYVYTYNGGKDSNH